MMENWPRREAFQWQYLTNTPCTWSMTVQLDVTRLVRSGAEIYPALLYALARVANRHEEFPHVAGCRGCPVYGTCCTRATGVPGGYGDLPASGHLVTRTPGGILLGLQVRSRELGRCRGFEPQPDVPAQYLTYASMLPWESFEGLISTFKRAGGFLSADVHARRNIPAGATGAFTLPLVATGPPRRGRRIPVHAFHRRA